MVERRRPQVWDVLEEVIKEHPVLLNRAPTLHRLGIQAFEPVLVEGKAIQIHPLVCTAFNADFDGDQMAVHLPLSSEAQAESRVLMLSANNILSPASGRPIVTPTQDMVIGAYYLTEDIAGAKGEGRSFRHAWEVFRALDEGALSLHAHIKLVGDRDGRRQPRDARHHRRSHAVRGGPPERLRRPLRSRHPGHPQGRHRRSSSENLAEQLRQGRGRRGPRRHQEHLLPLRRPVGPHHLDRGRAHAAREEGACSTSYEKEAEKVETQFRRGIITDGERRQQEVRIWTEATDQVRDAMERALKATRFNPIDMMVGSGARGNMMQVRQIAGMRGLVANPRGDMIPRPIKSNFREGLSMLEYFIATPGARKGLVDTALRTADSGLPHPASGRRGPGAHHPRGGLRHDPRHLDRERRARTRPSSATTSRPSCTAGPC